MDAGVIGRRGVLCSGAALFARRAAAAPPGPPTVPLAFSMVRHGREIGRHSVDFEAGGDVLTVRVNVDARVSILSIPIVRYRHQTVETWQAGRLVGLQAQTDRNGHRGWVDVRRTGEGLVVTGSGTRRMIAPDDALGITYWNRHQMEVPMIDLEDGVMQRPKIELRRGETIKLASGASIVADRYNLSHAYDADVWYDRNDMWASLAFGIADGSTIHYERR